MTILGIETSCDDTSVAIYNGKNLLANVISTQLIHRNFGGVVPELASRAHIQLILPVIHQALKQANILLQDIQGIAVTYGPGLVGSLLVGLSVAKGLSLSLHIPFIGINHLEGHIWANRLCHNSLTPPFMTLIVSGGHTQIVHVQKWNQYKIIGQTHDDAAGEAFDKVSKLLGLGYPGGPAIETHAKKGSRNYILFPRPILKKKDYDFSFSGLKTAVLNHVQTIGPDKTKRHLYDITCCFQAAVIDVLVEKTVRATQHFKVHTICLAGGVAVNKALQQHFIDKCSRLNISVLWPPPELCTDNGGMIACAGHYYLNKQMASPLSLSPSPSINL